MTITVEQVREEVMLLNVDNIEKFPCKEGKREDFRNLWLRFGPGAARDVILADIYNGVYPLPSEVFGNEKTNTTTSN